MNNHISTSHAAMQGLKYKCKCSASTMVCARRQSGFTLIELMVAAAMLAFILLATAQSVTTAQKVGEITESRAQALRNVDRVWLTIENDLRNVVSAPPKVVDFNEPVHALSLAITDEYLLSMLRSGQSNLLNLPRTELLYVGYRVEDGILWRDSWIDPFNPDPEIARAQQLLTGLEELEVMALPRPPVGRSVESGPWLDEWPSANAGPDVLPLALELTLRFEDERELSRLITLL